MRIEQASQLPFRSDPGSSRGFSCQVERGPVQVFCFGRGVQVVDAQLAGGLAAAGRGEGLQQPERLLIADDRFRVGGSLAGEPLGERCLQGRGEGGHRGSPVGPASRSAVPRDRAGTFESVLVPMRPGRTSGGSDDIVYFYAVHRG